MDFVRVLGDVSPFLTAGGFRYAVAGGVALAAYGHPRLTLDIDIVTDAAAREPLIHFMEAMGYETLYQSTGFSNHRHADRARGRVDFIFVSAATADRLFAGVRSLPGPGGGAMTVPRPEHLIAMKVQAMKNAPERTWQELVDIAYLMRLPHVDQTEIRRYFEKAGLLARWHELEERR